ncbi:hypothetical protein FIBSPDRAFT_893630 [Athelia psychrophila]|uniref:Uncharacterized protein n=1 Tax=Athelia psychrophila TaxID=1759441 RepID=A0A166GYE3_9AGAM|nr:hypothetical protein FIBSPDRAFT_893630 [Fibularhizoctonia sp. CBS 109695]
MGSSVGRLGDSEEQENIQFRYPIGGTTSSSSGPDPRSLIQNCQRYQSLLTWGARSSLLRLSVFTNCIILAPLSSSQVLQCRRQYTHTTYQHNENPQFLLVDDRPRTKWSKTVQVPTGHELPVSAKFKKVLKSFRSVKWTSEDFLREFFAVNPFDLSRRHGWIAVRELYTGRPDARPLDKFAHGADKRTPRARLFSAHGTAKLTTESQRGGVPVHRRARPPELASHRPLALIQSSNSAQHAQFHSLAECTAVSFGLRHSLPRVMVPADIITMNSHLGNTPCIGTPKSMLEGFSDQKAVTIHKWAHHQHILEEWAMRIGRENMMTIGIAATHIELGVEATLDIMDRRRRIMQNLRSQVTVDPLLGFIESRTGRSSGSYNTSKPSHGPFLSSSTCNLRSLSATVRGSRNRRSPLRRARSTRWPPAPWEAQAAKEMVGGCIAQDGAYLSYRVLGGSFGTIARTRPGLNKAEIMTRRLSEAAESADHFGP